MKRLKNWLCTWVLGALAGGLTAGGALAAEAPLSATEVRDLATEAYVYGYPLVTMEMTRRVMTNTAVPEGNHAPMGQFHHSRNYPDASFRDITAPNADTLYSTAWVDLSKEPYVLSLPDQKGRYFLMPLLDAWTTVFASPGTRTTGTRAQQFVITGPGWTGAIPQGMTELKSVTNTVWILGRTYCTGTPEDYAAVHALQDEYELRPLSQWGSPKAAVAGAPVNPAIDMKTPVRDQVNHMDAPSFFNLLAELLKTNPPTAEDAPLLEKLERLGIAPGKPFDAVKLGNEAILSEVPRLAQEKIMAQLETTARKVNGWMFSLETGRYGTDYLQRASVAAIGLGANLPEDAVYPVSTADTRAIPYDGTHQYVLHFEKAQMPPVSGFWSLTMYSPEYFFVANPLNRFTLSPRDTLKFNEDGSLDLYLQNSSPGAAKESNWLPAPAGKFVVMLRLYWPGPSVLDGTWQPPALKESTQLGQR